MTTGHCNKMRIVMATPIFDDRWDLMRASMEILMAGPKPGAQLAGVPMLTPIQAQKVLGLMLDIEEAVIRAGGNR